MISLRSLMQLHRVAMMLIFAGIVIWCAVSLQWDWLPKYQSKLIYGIGETLFLLFSTAAAGFPSPW